VTGHDGGRGDVGTPLRPGRALIGWMTPEAGVLALNRKRQDLRPTPEQLSQLEKARAAVAARSEGVDQEGAVTAAPPELDEHMAHLTQAFPHVLDGGWRPALVDLARLCVFQPFVLTDGVDERLGGLVLDNIPALAAVTLPAGPTTDYQTVFDYERNAWLLSSPDPNLQVTTRFKSAVPGQTHNVSAVGFHVVMARSVLQIGRFQDRWFLRDGYHRAFGLLRRGLRWVPALVREYANVADMLPKGMLQRPAFLGPRPPLMPDYFDDEVAADALVPFGRKVVLVQAMELRL
jgi:hypothetical protein